MDQIRTYFDQLVGIDDADWQVFSSRLRRREFPRKANLLALGEVERHLSFIESGSVRLFRPGKDEQDQTFGFCFAGEFVSAYDSFLGQRPSTYQ